MGPLDRPVWASLSGAHRNLSEGGELARRYRADINVFAAPRDEGEDSLRALASLVAPGEMMVMLQRRGISLLPGFSMLKSAAGVQMVAMRPVVDVKDARIAALGEADAADMLALATLTEPGPFRPNTWLMGRFVGIRINGRLAAMAGERMRPDGHVEVSGVCAHPDFRGQGLARLLSQRVAARIQSEGSTPFLHAWATNEAAVSLYESLGFSIVSDVSIAAFARSD
jgi:predicted GNAT family acetyltransferase